MSTDDDDKKGLSDDHTALGIEDSVAIFKLIVE
jgi:hypothetical protein